MTCERIQRLIGVYRELDRAERRMVQEHLRCCRTCQVAWQDELRVQACVRTAPTVEPSRGFESRLLSIPRQVPVASPMTAWLRGMGLVAAAAVGGALLLGLARLGPAAVFPPSLFLEPADSARPAAAGDAARRPQVIVRTTPISLEAPGAAGSAVGPASSAGQRAGARPAAVASSKSRPVAAKNAASTNEVVLAAPEPPSGANPMPDQPTDQAAPKPAPAGGDKVDPATTCVAVTVTVFADLAGDGGLDCAGCDGRWTGEDDAEAARRRLGLPASLQLLLYAGDVALTEYVVDAGAGSVGQTAVLSGCGVPAGTVVRVQLAGLAEGWSLCPASPGLVDVPVSGDGYGRAQFGLRAECPSAPPPLATDEAPTPSAQPPPTEAPLQPGPIQTP